MTAFLHSKQKKKRSQKYQSTIKATTLDPFGRATGFEKPVSSVTREQVQAFLHRNRDWSSRTVKTHHDYLRTFFRWCLKEGYTRLDPVEGFELPNPSKFNGVRNEGTPQERDYGTNLDRPVESVSWDDAIAFCEALTTQ